MEDSAPIKRIARDKVQHEKHEVDEGKPLRESGNRQVASIYERRIQTPENRALPARLIEVGGKLVSGERLDHADKSYLSRQRAKLLEDYNYHVADAEAERIKRLWGQGLSRRKIAKKLGRIATTVLNNIL